MKALKLLLVVLPAIIASAQDTPPSFYANLSGEWRINFNDDVRFANPETDDRDWKTVTLPWRTSVPIGVFWLRHSVSIPSGTGPQSLAIALGSMDGAFDIYANGVRFGSVSSDVADAVRPNVMLLPEETLRERKLLIAIRVNRPRPVSRPAANPFRDEGPYVLTTPALAESAVIDTIGKRQSRLTPFLVVGAMEVVMAVFLFVLWRSLSDWRVFLWLAILVLLHGLNFVRVFLSTVFNGEFFVYPTGPVVFSVLGELTAVALRIGGVAWRSVVWLACFGGVIAILVDSREGVVASTLIVTGIPLSISLGAIWLQPRDVRHTAVPLAFLSALVFLGHAGVIPLTADIAGWTWPVNGLGVSLFCIATVMVLLRQLAADRREKQRLASELEAARVVQQLLLAQERPDSGEFTMDAIYRPALEVGGDFYYLLKAEDSSFVLTVGDVSGKGLRAAMLVSLIIGALRETKERSPAAVLRALNAVVTGQGDGGFTTCCCARFDRGGVVTIANAGHLAPYRCGTEIEFGGGLPLGLDAEWDAEETILQLKAGEQITFVSDGVVEAASAKGELFGFDRTREISALPAGEIAAAAQAWGQNDDITVVTVRRRK